MTQEQKDLLLKDLSARLPYGVKISIPDLWTHKKEIETLDEIFKGDDGIYRVNSSGMCLEYVKPYLFPLSSMTEEQREELFTVVLDEQVSVSDCSFNDMTGYSEILTSYIMDAIDWLNANHFDYRGLIVKGLALDATNKNIYD